jgi:hypothetical protein
LSNRILIMQRGRIAKEVPAPPDAKPTEHDLIAWMLPGRPLEGRPEPGRPAGAVRVADKEFVS